MTRLLLATEVPFWLRSRGNQQRIAALVDYLGDRFELTIAYIGFLSPPPSSRNIAFKRISPGSGPRAWAYRVFSYLPGGLRNALVGLLNRRGYTRGPEDFRSEKVLREVRSILETGGHQALIVEYVWYAYLAEAAPRGVLKILDTHDVFHLRSASYAARQLVPDKTISEQQELQAYRDFDLLLAIQRHELGYLQARFPGRALLAMHPQAVRRGFYPPEREKNRAGRLCLLYLSGYADANLDALRWFVEQVWNERLASVFELKVMGGICDGLKLSAPGISLEGAVAHIEDAYRRADVAINPQRVGSGLKIKTVEALAYGVPLVTTPVGAHGLEAGASRAFLLAEDAQAFGDCLLSLRDEKARRELSAGAIAFAEKHLSAEACFGELVTWIGEHARD